MKTIIFQILTIIVTVTILQGCGAPITTPKSAMDWMRWEEERNSIP